MSGASREDLKTMDPHGVVDDPKKLKLSAQGQGIAKFMAAVLEKHFPGWAWGITVDERGGVAHVFAMELSGEMGYTLLLDDLQNAGRFDWKMILMAGGEILERYGIPRGPKTPEAMLRVRTGPNGLPMPDVSDKNRGLIKHLVRRRALYGVDEVAMAVSAAVSNQKSH